MTIKEILQKGTFSQDNEVPELAIDLYIPFFERFVKIQVYNFSPNASEAESGLVTRTINDLLSFPQENHTWLKQKIYEHYLACMANIDYGSGKSKDAVAINNAHFKIATAEDAYRSAELKAVWFDVSYTDFIYFNLEYRCPWEAEHGIKIGVMNGQFDSIQ